MLKHLVTFIFIGLSLSGYSQFRRVRVNTSVGYGYMTGRIQSDLPRNVEKHFRDLKLGNLYEIDLGYEVNDVWGFGLFFSNLHSSDKSSFDGGFFDESLADIDIDVDSNIKLNFIAPKLYFFLSEEYHKHQLVGSFSVGYLRYNNNSAFRDSFREVSANTVGLGVSLDYEYKITPFVYLNSRFSALVSFVSEFDIEDEAGSRTVSVSSFTNGERERENLSYMGLTIGVRVDIDKPGAREGYNDVENDNESKLLKGDQIKELRQSRSKEIKKIRKVKAREIKKIKKKG